MEGDMMEQGTLKVQVTADNYALPVAGAKVTVSGMKKEQLSVITKEDGNTPVLGVETPPVSESQKYGSPMPYALYDVLVESSGYPNMHIFGVQAFPDSGALVEVDYSALMTIHPITNDMRIDIPPSRLFTGQGGEPKGPISGSMVNSTKLVTVPDYISVHMGLPGANGAVVMMLYKDYIKNVASGLLSPTWPQNALRAGIHAIVGVTLNRIYTQWYRKNGYPYDITASPSVDQSYVEGRQIFDNISDIVDEIYDVYPSKKGVNEPLFSAYCTLPPGSGGCSGMPLWDMLDKAYAGLSSAALIQYYFGNDVELTQPERSAITDLRGYPGKEIIRGMRGDPVRSVQRWLNILSSLYRDIPSISEETGFFGNETELALKAFMRRFGLDGASKVDKKIWVALSKAAEDAVIKIENDMTASPILQEESSEPKEYAPYPGEILRQGDRGKDVVTLQNYLIDLSRLYEQIPKIEADGIFGKETRAAVVAFQKLFGLSADGLVGPITWDTMIRELKDTK